MAAAAGAMMAAAAAASTAGAAMQLEASSTHSKVVPPDLRQHRGGEATASVLTIGGIHTIVGTLLDADDEWLVLRGRNGNHFLISVSRLLAIQVPPAPEGSLPRST